MIDKLISFSIYNRYTVLVVLLILVVFGIYSARRLPIDAVPDITNDQVEVLTLSPNLGPLEIEKFVTTPIELEMYKIPRVAEIRSISKFGLSSVKVIFEDGVDLYWARIQVIERLKDLEGVISKEFGTPFLAPITTGLGEIYQYIIRNKEPDKYHYTLAELRTIQDWTVRKQLMGTKGVADVSSSGGRSKEYQAKIRPERMRAAEVTIDELFNALKYGNSNTGGAYIEKDNKSFVIRGIGIVTNLDDIASTVVKKNGSVPVLVRDVADVEYGYSTRYGAMTIDGEGEVVGGIILMRKGENAVQVVDNVKKRIAQINKELPEGLEIEPFINRENFVGRAIKTVVTNLIEGGIIVIAVILLFLGNWRASLLAASVIPLSMLFAIILMNQFGVYGNLMSLGAIDFGMIVDGAIIVVESVMLFYAVNTEKNAPNSYKQRQKMVLAGTLAAKKSVIFGCLIILIVYFPILTLTDIEGKMFSPMALTVSFAIAGALILAITYVPMMSAWLIIPPENPHDHGISEKIIQFIYRYYEPIIKWSLKNIPWVIIISAAMLGLGTYFFTAIGGEFLPKLDEGDFSIEVRLPVGTALTQTIGTSTKIQKELRLRFPDEIEKLVSKIGTSEIPTDPMPPEAMDLVIVLKNKQKWKKAFSKLELADSIAATLKGFPGLVISIQQPIENRFNELLSGARTDVAIKLYGDDLDTMIAKGDQIMRLAAGIPGAVDAQVQRIAGLPQIIVKYDRRQMAIYGITVNQINTALQTAFAGAITGVVYEGDKRYNLTVRLGRENRNNIQDIQNLFIEDKDRNPVPLKELAEITESIGPSEVHHENLRRKLNIGFNVRGRDIESLVNELQQKIKTSVKLPKGYKLVYGGQFENLSRAKARLGLVTPISLLIIFILLYATFGNIKDGLLIFSAIPLSAVGGVFSLWVRGMNFSISAGIGFIALFGVAVLNGILLIGHFNLLKDKNEFQNLQEVVLAGLREKFRPVVMTSLVAALGFVPMAISESAGAEVQRPLATVVVGGLITATILTLIVLPVLYTVFSKKYFNVNGSGNAGLAYISSFLLIFCVVIPGFANQNDNKITEKQAIEMALTGNPQIKLADQKIEQQRALLPSVVNFTNFDFFIEAPTGVGMRPDLLQTFNFPTVYSQQYKSQKKQIEVTASEKKVNQNLLVFNLRNVFNQLQFLVEKEKVLFRYDSLLSDLLDVNEVRYNVGQISNLEKLNGESKYRLIQNQLLQTRVDMKSSRYYFALLLGKPGDTTFVPLEDFTKREVLSDISVSVSHIDENPLVEYYEKQLDFSRRQLKVEKHKRLPGIMLGYFDQADHTQLKYQFRYGLSLPIWYWTYQSKINAAKKSVDISETQIEVNNMNLISQYSQAIAQYKQYTQSLEYFQNIGLRQAAEIIKSAQASFKAGSIGYYFYLQNLEQAFQIRLAYLDALRNFNQAVISLQYLSGQTD